MFHSFVRTEVQWGTLCFQSEYYLHSFRQTHLSARLAWKGKVKCTLVQALRLCTGRTAHRGNRGIALPFHDHGTRRGWGASVTPRPLFTPGKNPVPIVQEAGWAPGPVWTGKVNLTPHRDSISGPSRPLYRRRLAWCHEITSLSNRVGDVTAVQEQIKCTFFFLFFLRHFCLFRCECKA